MRNRTTRWFGKWLHQSIKRYLRFFGTKELFWNPGIFPRLDSPHLFGDDLPLELAKSQFQRIWERHGLPTLHVKLRKMHRLTCYPSMEFTPSATEVLSTVYNPQLHL